MPRTSRSVAQRLASQRSSKKRKPSRSDRTEAPNAAPPPVAPPSGPAPVTVDQILDEVVPSEGGARVAATPTLTPAATRSPSGTRRTGTGRASARIPVVRRRYAEYAEEYGYIWADLRRILWVAGALIVLLIVASFFIQ